MEPGKAEKKTNKNTDHEKADVSVEAGHGDGGAVGREGDVDDGLVALLDEHGALRGRRVRLRARHAAQMPHLDVLVVRRRQQQRLVGGVIVDVVGLLAALWQFDRIHRHQVM